MRQQASAIHTHHRHSLLLLSPKADTHFTVPRKVEGCVNLGTAVRECSSPCPRLNIAMAVVINTTNCLRWDSNMGPLTPQSCMLPLDHCDLQRHMGVNNLAKVVTRQRGGREWNWTRNLMVASSTPQPLDYLANNTASEHCTRLMGRRR